MSNRASRLDQMRKECQAFHEAHPEVWVLFERFTFDRIDVGWPHFVVGAIWERIRWEQKPDADGKLDFKLNNNYRAFYARRFMRKYPEHAGYFRTRTQTSAECDAARLGPLVPADFPYDNQVD